MVTKKKTAAKKKTAKKKTTKKVSKVKAQPVEELPAPEPSPEKDGFQLKLSKTLQEKAKDLAEEEGLDVEDFLAELISEGMTVRAFDQWEKRQHLRGSSVGNQNNNAQQGNNNNRHGNRGGNRNNRNRKGMNQARYHNIMDDNSSFLEYVRNQERKGGR